METATRKTTVVHLIAPQHGKFTCCGRTPFEVPMRDAMTTDPKEVTCRRGQEEE